MVQTSVLVANRAQAASGGDTSLRSKPRIGTFEAIRQIVKRRGLLGLYTGFHLHALRDTVGTAMYFGIYETVKKVAAKEMGSEQSTFGAPAIAGAICSTIPWFCVSISPIYQIPRRSDESLIVRFRPTPSTPARPERRACCSERARRSTRHVWLSPSPACTRASPSF